jgi:hypothetical protein
LMWNVACHGLSFHDGQKLGQTQDGVVNQM